MNSTTATITAMSQTSDRTKGIAFGVAAGAVWGLAFVAPALAKDFPAIYITIGRFLIYGLLAVILIAPRWKALRPRLTRWHVITLSWLAVIGNTLFYFLLVQGVQWGGIAMVALVMGFVPVTVTVIGSLEKDSVPLLRLMPSIILCVAGAVLIALNALGHSSASRPLLGLLCAIGALSSWTAYAVANARILRKVQNISAHDWNLLLGVITGLQAIVLLPVLLLLPEKSYAASQWLNLLGVVTGLAIFCSLMGYTFWNRMSQLLPMTMIGQMIVFETIFALLYGLLWEMRLPTLYEGAALSCVLLSMFASVIAHRSPRHAAT